MQNTRLRTAISIPVGTARHKQLDDYNHQVVYYRFNNLPILDSSSGIQTTNGFFCYGLS
jgi:hypothetical protein